MGSRFKQAPVVLFCVFFLRAVYRVKSEVFLHISSKLRMERSYANPTAHYRPQNRPHMNLSNVVLSHVISNDT